MTRMHVIHQIFIDAEVNVEFVRLINLTDVLARMLLGILWGRAVGTDSSHTGSTHRTRPANAHSSR